MGNTPFDKGLGEVDGLTVGEEGAEVDGLTSSCFVGCPSDFAGDSSGVVGSVLSRRLAGVF